MGRNGWRGAALVWLGAAGCWKTDLPQLPSDAVAFAPSAVEVPPGWIVDPIPTTLRCPDREPSTWYLVHPTEPSGPMPAAVLFHSGAFDYVFAPDPADPLDGSHYATPDRLTAEWATRQVFATLGMVPSDVPGEEQAGTLPAALAEQGVAILLPANCWGDWWHNLQGTAENQFADPNGDFFFRNGRAGAEWGFRFLLDPGFAASQQVTLPITADTTRLYALGLGNGGRAVGELLNVDGADADTAPDLLPAGILVDSLVEDLAPWYADPARHSGEVAGLDRIFPGGQATSDQGSLYAAPELPDRTLYAFDPDDPSIPAGAHGRMLQRIAAEGGVAWPVTSEAHPVTNGPDPEVARAAVSYLLEGTEPPPSFVGTLDSGGP